LSAYYWCLGSDPAERAIPYAEWLTKFFDARLFVLFLKRGTDLDYDAYVESKTARITGHLGQVKLRTAHGPRRLGKRDH